MSRIALVEPPKQYWYPDPWRMALIALCTLVLCSCRGRVGQHAQPCPVPNAGIPHATLPPVAYTGPAVPMPQPMLGYPGMENGVPVPYAHVGPWAPPQMSQPWPQDEYIRDGGDRNLGARVGEEWQVHGMDTEDTIAHFDTVDGRTLVEPSNKVHIYAPRFGAVRQISNVVAKDLYVKAAGYHSPLTLASPTETSIAATSKQQIEANRQVGRKLASIYESEQGDGVMSTTNKARGMTQDMLLPYENFTIIRSGQLEMAETAQLAKSVENAMVWSGDQAPQIIIDEQAAQVDNADVAAQMFFTVHEPPANPKIRLVKVASTPFAEPGDEVSFTLRFDNVGNQMIGNVTIIDNLTGRLEYVPGSAQCSVDAEFSTQPNEADSLVIRCEVIDPLEPGEGGVIRFRCIVR